MFRKMPFILVIVILAITFLDSVIPFAVKQLIYSVSLMIKEVIVLLLPLIIFCLLFKSIVMLSSNATKIIGVILIFVCCSNFLAAFLSHYIGILVYDFDLSLALPKKSKILTSLWDIKLPRFIGNDTAMFLAIIFAIISAKFNQRIAKKIAAKLEQLVGKILQSMTYLIPMFVIGFIVKLDYEGAIGFIVKDYTTIFAFVAIAQFSYIFLLYLLLSKGRIQECLANIKNMIPAVIAGFSTMSSAASMPLTIIGIKNNSKNKDLATSLVPITVNIHLLGDCFAIPIFAYAVLKSFGIAEPSLYHYLIFTFYFVIAKFTVAAIPGGGIIVMLPILEKYLGFNTQMMSLITALYILFDPIITCVNILGNGAFAKMIDKYVSPMLDQKSA